MEPWQEAVRGRPMPASALGLSGFEQLRFLTAFPSTPATHLTGLVLTQAGHGVAAMRMPASPWLQHQDSVVELSLLASTTAAAAATSVLPPGVMVKPKTHAYSQLRMCPADGRRLLARGRVLHSTPHLIFVEVTVEDEDGRLISHSAAHHLVVPSAAPPGEPPPTEPAEMPSYPTPDPYLRAVSPEKRQIFETFLSFGGMELARLVFGGAVPRAPLYELVGMSVGEKAYAEGSVTVSMPASPWLVYAHPHVLPGWIETLAFEAAGAACHTIIGPGLLPACLSFSSMHLDTVEPDGRLLGATARAQQMADDVVIAHVEVTSDDGRPVATATLGARPIPLHRPRREESRRVLATVLFTDIVESTKAAERLGDQRWSELLTDHKELTRRHLRSFDGREIQTTGDGFLATFDSPTRALRCAERIRDAVGALGLQIRAGLHTGEVEVARTGEISGLAVHIASRIQATGAPGDIMVSETTRVLAAPDSRFKDRGLHALKGIDDDVRVFALLT